MGWASRGAFRLLNHALKWLAFVFVVFSGPYLLGSGSVIIQTDPKAFDPSLPVHTVTIIDKAAGIVTLSGSDGTSLQVTLNSWGPTEWTEPIIGSKVQLLPGQPPPKS